jgi:predicted DNA-binding ArsR family transcriptional regulator
MTHLEDISKIIEADVPVDSNVGDAPIEEDLVVIIKFSDLSDAKKVEIEDELMKNMKATDAISKSNLIRTLQTNPIFEGSIKSFRILLGIENI